MHLHVVCTIYRSHQEISVWRCVARLEDVGNNEQINALGNSNIEDVKTNINLQTRYDVHKTFHILVRRNAKVYNSKNPIEITKGAYMLGTTFWVYLYTQILKYEYNIYH